LYKWSIFHAERLRVGLGGLFRERNGAFKEGSEPGKQQIAGHFLGLIGWLDYLV
jgi:hypothetical protein